MFWADGTWDSLQAHINQSSSTSVLAVAIFVRDLVAFGVGWTAQIRIRRARLELAVADLLYIQQLF